MREFILIAIPTLTLGIVLWGAFWPHKADHIEPSEPLEREALEQSYE